MIFSIQNFRELIFSLPKVALTEIEKKCRAFLWTEIENVPWHPRVWPSSVEAGMLAEDSKGAGAPFPRVLESGSLGENDMETVCT